MPNKYRHILLPTQLVGDANSKSFHKQGRSKELPGFDDRRAYKQRLRGSAASLTSFSQDVTPQRRVRGDQLYVDFKMKVQGPLKEELFTKYNLDVKARYDDRKKGQDYQNDTIIARISLDKRPGQQKSEFEKLERDLNTYIESPKDKLKTYFGLIEELSPVTPASIMNDSLVEKMQSQDQKFPIDVVFSEDKLRMDEKIRDIQQLLHDDFVDSINTQLVHVCHLNVNFETLKLVFASYSGIVSVEESLKIIFSSSTPSEMGDYELEIKATNRKPVLIADHPMDRNHPLLDGVVIDQIGGNYNANTHPHGTQVGSLVAYGTRLSTTGRLVVENYVASVNAFKELPNGAGLTLNEDSLKEALSKYASQTDVLVLNMSINAQDILYERKIPHWLSVLVDEYSNKYNCLFIVSAGNLFNENWPQELVDRLVGAGYPKMFEDECAVITPPADSVNALSVGSIAYVSNPNSISPQYNPTFITRRGLVSAPSFNFLKPDLVHYDSNYGQNYASEDNGPYMTFPGGGVGRASGTSFAAPLVAHDAGLLVQTYPRYSINSIKGLLVHFADKVGLDFDIDNDVKKTLTGHGVPNIEKALYSLSSMSTIVIEDTIQVGTIKKVRVPIPSSIGGSSEKRLKVRKTLVYNPTVSPADVSFYTPAYLTAKIVRDDGQPVDKLYSSSYLDGAHRTSNVKCYKAVELRTLEHTGVFWEIEVMAEASGAATPTNYSQPYSLIITLEDILHSDEINIHEEIRQMIEVEVGVDVTINA